MSALYICGLEEMPRHVAAIEPSHLISLVTPDSMPDTPPEVIPANHLQVAVHDIVEPYPDAILPSEAHIEAIIEFARGWDVRSPMLIHCYAGVSRSTAAALIVACVHFPDREAEIAEHLREVAPHAHPNRLMIELADRVQAHGGALVDAVDSIGSGELIERATLVELSLAWLQEGVDG